MICASVSRPAGHLQATSMRATPKLVFAQFRVHELSVYAVKPNINQTCQKWKSRELLSTFNDKLVAVYEKGREKWLILRSSPLSTFTGSLKRFPLRYALRMWAPLTRWCQIAWEQIKTEKRSFPTHQNKKRPLATLPFETSFCKEILSSKIQNALRYQQPGDVAKWRNHLLGVLDPRHSRTAATKTFRKSCDTLGSNGEVLTEWFSNAFTYQRTLNPLVSNTGPQIDSEETALLWNKSRERYCGLEGLREIYIVKLENKMLET